MSVQNSEAAAPKKLQEAAGSFEASGAGEEGEDEEEAAEEGAESTSTGSSDSSDEEAGATADAAEAEAPAVDASGANDLAVVGLRVGFLDARCGVARGAAAEASTGADEDSAADSSMLACSGAFRCCSGDLFWPGVSCIAGLNDPPRSSLARRAATELLAPLTRTGVLVAAAAAAGAELSADMEWWI